MEEKKDKGLRFNEGKPRYDLIHPIAEKGLVDVLTFGSTKYEEHNWEKGMRWSKVIASLKRHMAAIERGEDYDKESGLLHIDHLQCNAHFLSAYYHIYPQGDDRQHKYLKTPKIGLDIDDVICDFVGGFMSKFNLKEPSSWNWSYKTKECFDYLLSHPEELKEFYLSLKPKCNPQDISFEPHCYITSRTVPIEITKQWIEENNFPCSNVYSIPFNTSKVDVIKESGVEIFVDDRFDNFVEINNAGICCYLFDAKHNQRYNVGSKRIFNLNELV